MRLGKDLTGKPIISISDGRLIGYAKDLFVNQELTWIAGIFTGSEGLIGRKAKLVQRQDVVVFGIDAILVKHPDVETDNKELEEANQWLRLEKLRGREVDTPGGTKVGAVGDIMIGEEGEISGFTLGRVFVEGPIAEKGIIPRSTIIDTGQVDGLMTVDLQKTEQHYLGTPENVEEEE